MTTQRKNVNKEQFFTQHATAKRLGILLQSQPWFPEITNVVESN